MVDPSLRKSFSLKAVIKPTALTLNTNAFSIYTGKGQKLTATLTPVNTTYPVTWSSSNPAAATVAPGKATITATCGDKSASATVTVVKTPPIEVLTPHFYYAMNSVNGVTLHFTGYNRSGKVINYYTLNFTYIDGVGNPTRDEAPGKPHCQPQGCWPYKK